MKTEKTVIEGIRKGVIISIEGVDGSGKETQSRRLLERLKEAGHDVILRSFPNYSSDASILVKMYLNGDFGDNAADVSPYIASTFFASDRYASYKTDWEKFYLEGGIVILDRYTTANMVHQAGKIDDLAERGRFLEWLYDFEFNLYGLPVPDRTFFLDIPLELREKLVEGRKNKITGDSRQDIHERDESHIRKAREAGLFVADRYSWSVIDCSNGMALKSIEEINDEILEEVMNLLGSKI